MSKVVIEKDFSKYKLSPVLEKSISHSHLLTTLSALDKIFDVHHNFFCLIEESEIVAFCPLHYLKSFSSNGKVWGSYNFCYYECFFAVDDSRKNELIKEVEAFCTKNNKPCELPSRTSNKSKSSIHSFFYFKFLEGLSLEDQLFPKMNKRSRSYLRKALKEGYFSELLSAGFIDQFYQLYSQNMSELGSPPKPKKYFTLLLKALPQKASILLIHDKNKIPIAGALLVELFDGEWFVPIIATPKKTKSKQSQSNLASYFLYYEILNTGFSNNGDTVNFGRSVTSSGHFTFKERFGLEHFPVYYHDFKLLPNPPISQSKSYQLASKIWKKLPLFLHETLGAPITRYLG